MLQYAHELQFLMTTKSKSGRVYTMQHYIFIPC